MVDIRGEISLRTLARIYATRQKPPLFNSLSGANRTSSVKRESRILTYDPEMEGQ